MTSSTARGSSPPWGKPTLAEFVRKGSVTDPVVDEPPTTGGHVFISHSHNDHDVAYASRLVGQFEAAGVKAWIDKQDIDFGSRYTTVIRDAVDSSSAMVVIMTPAAEASEWVELEILRAKQEDIPIYPLLLAGPPFFRLSGMHHEDVSDGSLPSDRFIQSFRS